MTAPTNAAPAPLEAVARLTWHGADVALTVRADDPAILARRLGRALAALRSAPNAAPALAPSAARVAPATCPAPPALAAPVQSAQTTTTAAPVCPVHAAPLTWRTPKDGGAGWWSHRTADGAWCRGA